VTGICFGEQIVARERVAGARVALPEKKGDPFIPDELQK